VKVRVTFDINKARLVHLGWVMRVEKSLELGPDFAPCALQPYHDCELGLWLHGEARIKYQHFDDVRRLSVEHRRFHHAVEQLLLALHEGEKSRTQELLIGVRHMSKEIIYLLTLLELRTLEQERKMEFGGGLFQAIASLFHEDESWLEGPKTKDASPSIDITYARLAHLRWASRLDQRFRNFGQGVAIQAHDRCDFGTWIQRVGLKKYADLKEVQLLDTVHKGFHEAATRLIRCLQARHLQRADESYADVQNLSREIAWLLTILEYRVSSIHALEEQRQPVVGSPPHDCGPKITHEAAVVGPVSQLSPIMAVAQTLMGR